MGRVVNQTNLAEIVGVTDVTIWDWQKNGMPMLVRGERGAANQYDTEAVIKWMIDREVKKVSTETNKDRLSRLQGDMLEIDLAKEKRVLVPVTEIEPTWQTRVLSAAAFLSGQPSRLASILDATPGVEAKRQVIRTQFAEFLTKLGVNGEQMQADVEELLAKVSRVDAEAFLKRIARYDDKQDSAGDAQPPVGNVRPSAEGPALGVG